MSAPSTNDPYRRLDYRRQIAWPKRIERESPFLMSELGRAPVRSVIDLGCGTGEHARHFAANGFRATGIDRSREQIETAREYEDECGALGPRFLCGEMADLPTLTSARFGAAICLGNVLPHLDEDDLTDALSALASRMHEKGRLIAQIVNYERLARRSDRHLPINVREDPESSGEIVFLRLLKADGDRHVLFYPSTLLLRPGATPPLEVKASAEVRLRAWRLHELREAFAAQGFRIDGVYGDMEAGLFDEAEAADLVVTAALES